MKEQTGGKKGKWLWVVIGVVVLLAIAAIALAFILGGQKDNADVPDLYWNVDREVNTDPDTGLSTRQPKEDGNYYIRFAHNGEQVELPVADKQLVGIIDTMDLLELSLNEDGFITGVKAVKDAASVLGEGMCIQEVTEDTIVVNSSIAMSGKKIVLKITDQLHIYNVSGKGEFVGQQITPQDLQTMDLVSIYGSLTANGEEGVATHLFLTDQWEIGKAYWRVNRYYDSKAKVTTRTPDENGVYTVPFYCDGETVDLKFKDKSLVDLVDYASTTSCYFGFEFDADGYAVKILRSFKATHTLLQCDGFDILELGEDGSYLAADISGTSGKEVRGVIGEDCAIYDISATAKAENATNRKLDGLRLHDRVYIWTDTLGNPVLIYVTARRADSPAYYNPDPQYDSDKKQTTRIPNADGYYEIDLLKAGDTETQTYYVKDVKMVNTIDKSSDLCVGLKVGEGNVVEYVYGVDCIFGNSYFCRGYYVKEANASMVVLTSKSGKTTKNGMLANGCKVWNVSDTGEFGAETTFQEGDCVYAVKAPSGEIINAYIIDRA